MVCILGDNLSCMLMVSVLFHMHCLVWSRILPYLQANKLARCFFMGERWRALLFTAQNGGVVDKPRWDACTQSRIHYRRRTLSLGKLPFYTRQRAKPALCLRERHYLIPQSCPLQTHPWEMAQVKISWGLAFLACPPRQAGMQEISGDYFSTYFNRKLTRFFFCTIKTTDQRKAINIIQQDFSKPFDPSLQSCG